MAEIFMVGMTPKRPDLFGNHETLTKIAYGNRGDAQAACDRLSTDPVIGAGWNLRVVPVELFSRT
jgi:hypothetical protein